tara:strand:+ start:85 stop:246 length:162 start_codon:yes stop_codon:yes gene_type:complete
MTRKELKKIWEDELADVPWELVKRVQFHEKVNDDRDKLIDFVRTITKNNTNFQ